ncbi:lig4, partial [Symbiodinium sp. CCMP2456]
EGPLHPNSRFATMNVLFREYPQGEIPDPDGELELERRKDLRPGFIGPVDSPELRERR